MLLNDDRCSVRDLNGLWILGMLRRLVVSLYMHWRSKQPKPQHLSLTDFQSDMGAPQRAGGFSGQYAGIKDRMLKKLLLSNRRCDARFVRFEKGS